MTPEELLTYAIVGFWTGIFVALAYLSAHIIVRIIKPGIGRALAIVPLYLAICATVFVLPFSLAIGVGILFGAFFGIPAGLVVSLMVLARLDKRQN